MTFQLKVIILASLLVFSGLMELKIFAQETDNKKGWVSPLTKIQFLKIPAGCFQMGSNQGFKFEAPVHKVCVDSFYLGKYEVTQKQWSIFNKSNLSRFKGENHPVQRVSWNDAKNYIIKLNNSESTKKYRLPTEAEWEFACRAGSQGNYVCITSDKLKSYAYYNANSDNQTQPVGTRQANRWGLFGMHGNVCEWCQDVYDPEYYQISPTLDPRGPSTSAGDVKRVIRGGSWKASERMCRSSFRQGQRTGDTDACFSTDYCGFRCVRRMAIETWNLLQKNQVQNGVTTPKANSSDSK